MVASESWLAIGAFAVFASAGWFWRARVPWACGYAALATLLLLRVHAESFRDWLHASLIYNFGIGPFVLIGLGAMVYLVLQFEERRWWVALALCGALLGVFLSGNTGAADPMLAWFEQLGLTSDQAAMAVFIARKTIHFAAYGVIGVAAAIAAPDRFWIAGLGWALPHALLDELMQLRASGRTGSAWDVALDAAGAVCFLGVAATLRRRKK